MIGVDESPTIGLPAQLEKRVIYKNSIEVYWHIKIVLYWYSRFKCFTWGYLLCNINKFLLANRNCVSYLSVDEPLHGSSLLWTEFILDSNSYSWPPLRNLARVYFHHGNWQIFCKRINYRGKFPSLLKLYCFGCRLQLNFQQGYV